VASRARDRCLFVCGGPHDGQEIKAHHVRGAWTYLDRNGVAYPDDGPGRLRYNLGGERLVFAGHGSVECPNCGCTLDPDPDTGRRLDACPLCGRSTGGA
jgi:hypothetical protein